VILTSSSDELYSESDSDVSDIANNLLLPLFNRDQPAGCDPEHHEDNTTLPSTVSGSRTTSDTRWSNPKIYLQGKYQQSARKMLPFLDKAFIRQKYRDVEIGTKFSFEKSFVFYVRSRYLTQREFFPSLSATSIPIMLINSTSRTACNKIFNYYTFRSRSDSYKTLLSIIRSCLIFDKQR